MSLNTEKFNYSSVVTFQLKLVLRLFRLLCLCPHACQGKVSFLIIVVILLYSGSC